MAAGGGGGGGGWKQSAFDEFCPKKNPGKLSEFKKISKQSLKALAGFWELGK